MSNIERSSNYGIDPPLVKQYPSGANDSYSAGIAIGQHKTDHQMDLIHAAGGRGTRYRSHRKKTRRHTERRPVKPKNMKILCRAKYNQKRKNVTRRNSIYRVYCGRSHHIKRTNRAKRTSANTPRPFGNSIYPTYRASKSMRTRRGGNGQIAVNTFHLPYTETGAGNQTVNGISAQITETSATAHANRQYDQCAGLTPDQCAAVTGSH